MEDDTIVAVSTPPGRGALGVIRLSGPSSVAIAQRLTGSHAFTDRSATLVRIRDPGGAELDQAVITPFFGPNSYTGEDLVEISCHGNPMILDRIAGASLALGARDARPGEFTLRAFLNGRIDLTQAEAVVDMAEARTDAGLALALRQLEGDLRRRVEPVRSRLVDELAYLTALVEFSEEDIPAISGEEMVDTLTEAVGEIDVLLRNSRQGQVLRHGVSLAVVGPPNAGKSSILNGLLGRDRAIVSAVPGTTRDTIEEELTVGGVLFRIVDTAGLGQTLDPVEAIGIERSHAALAGANLVLLVVDGSRLLADCDTPAFSVLRDREAGDTIVALNKSDLPRRVEASDLQALVPDVGVVSTSAVAPGGLDVLRDTLLELALGGPPPDGFVLSNQRHIKALTEAAAFLTQAIEARSRDIPLDLVSLDLRAAVDRLGEVLGIDAADDVLDRVFSRFCIGK